jgi:EAL domain-containing protein (putative c-di-GMP-specific phosphodiesterase class I)
MRPRTGRRRTHLYRIDDVHTQRHHAEMDWAARLSDAVDSVRLVLHGQRVQPLQESQRGDGLNFEVLVRMRDTDGTLFIPRAFLPAAERFDLMTLIDRWIIAILDELGVDYAQGFGIAPPQPIEELLALAGEGVARRAWAGRLTRT